MKKSFLLMFLLFNGIAVPVCISQNLLSEPESIIYDSLHHRYLLSNYQTGDIVQVDSNGSQSYLVQGVHAIQGLEIVNNAVYVGCDSLIRGFDLETGAMVMNVHVTGVSNLNDVTADASGNLYAGDVFGTKIIKVNIASQQWWVYVNGNGIYHPNGIFFDKPFNRILVCSYCTNSPIQSVSLYDSTVTTLTSTTLSDCDGITRDKYGRCYVTSWETNSIYRFDSAFSGPPTFFYSNPCGVADISYDRVHDLIAIPLMNCNSYYLKAVDPPVGLPGDPEGSLPSPADLIRSYPNPASTHITVEFSDQTDELFLSDLPGNILEKFKTRGLQKLDIDLSLYRPGIYWLKFRKDGRWHSGKVILMH